MPSTDPNKAYIKKHKINDILNELFKKYTEIKPDDPIEFGHKYFQDKLSPKVEVGEEKSNDLMAKLMQKQGLAMPSLANKDNSKTEHSKNSFALSNFHIMKKVDRILASNIKQETPDDILEHENFICHSADTEAGDQVDSSKKIIKYKNHLDKRDKQTRHREDLEKLLLEQIDKENNKKHENEVNRAKKGKVIEEDQYLLMNEVAGNSVQAPREVEVGNVKERVVRVDTPDMSKRKSRFMSKATPQETMLVCQMCQKLQSQLTHRSNNSNTLVKQSIDSPKANNNNTAASGTQKPLNESFKKQEDTKNDIFDLLLSTDEPVKLEDLKPATKKDTTRTARTNDDDDFIESASQVSGPRGIESFDPMTNRSTNDIISKPLTIEEPNKIMAWLLTKQQAEENQLEKNLEEKKEPSLVGSNTSNRTLRSTGSKAKSAITSASGNQKWNMIGSSSSERSSVTRRNK